MSRASNLAGFSTSIQSVAPNNLVVGVITATTFSGNVTGNVTGTASTASFATTSFGLSGSPNITVGNITGVAATFSGNVSIAGTLTYEDVTNVDAIGLVTARSGIVVNAGGINAVGVITGTSFVGSGITITGISTANDTRLLSVGERTTIINGNTASLVYNTGGGNIAICTNPSADITLNVTGIPTDTSFNNTAISFSVFVVQTGTARTVTAVNLNGVPETIRWAGGSLASAISGVTTTSGYDIYSFTGINTVGSASTAANYQVLGVVNGGFA